MCQVIASSVTSFNVSSSCIIFIDKTKLLLFHASKNLSNNNSCLPVEPIDVNTELDPPTPSLLKGQLGFVTKFTWSWKLLNDVWSCSQLFTVSTYQASFARCARRNVTPTQTMDIHPLLFRSTNRPWTQTTRRRFLSATTCCQDNLFSTALDACIPLSSVRMLNTVTSLRFVIIRVLFWMFIVYVSFWMHRSVFKQRAQHIHLLSFVSTFQSSCYRFHHVLLLRVAHLRCVRDTMQPVRRSRLQRLLTNRVRIKMASPTSTYNVTPFLFQFQWRFRTFCLLQLQRIVTSLTTVTY